MRFKLGKAIRRRSAKSLALLLIVGVLALLFVGGGVYALLGGVGRTNGTSDVELQRGLIGWWKLNGDAKDSTPYADNGAITASVTAAADREGTSSGAMTFDGTSGYINVPNASALNPTGAVSVSAWVNTSNLTNTAGIISKDTSVGISNPPYVLQVTGASNRISFSTTNAANTTVTISSGSLSTGTWYLVTGTFDGSTMTLYINGTSVATAAQTDIAATTGSLKIGQQKTGFSRFYTGLMDDARLYNRGLSAAEVTALYKQYSPQINLASGENGLIGWWKLNGNATDSTPYGNNGTTNAVSNTTDREGAANGAYSFNGTTSYVTLPGPVVSTNATISGWFNYSNGAAITSLFRDNTCANGWLLYNNGVNINFRMGGTQYATSLLGATYANKWTMFTITKNGANVVLYVNGVSQFTGAGAGNTASAMPWSLMRNGSCSNFVAGSAQDFRIYNRALSGPEVTALYGSYNSQINLQSSPTSGTTSNLNVGLAGYWPFNGNSADATPYGNKGTNSGVTLTADRKGRSNSAYSLNGTTQNITVTATLLPTTAITVSAWVYDTGSGSSFTRFLNNNWIANGWLLFANSSLTPYFGVGDAGAGQHNASCAAGSLTANTWHMLTGTYDGTTVKVYLDGTVCATTAALASQALRNTGTFQIAAPSTNASPFSIDDVRIYKRALTPAEISLLYKNYY